MPKQRESKKVQDVDRTLDRLLPGLGKLNAGINNLCDQLSVDDPQEVIRMISADEVEIKRRLLKPDGDSVTLPGAYKFHVTNGFAPGEHPDGVRIVSVNEAFQENFFGKVERNLPRVIASPYKLTCDAHDADIMSTLAVLGRVETWLYHVRELMGLSQNGTKSPLQFGSNIFYPTMSHQHWVLDVFRPSDHRGWCVNVFSVERQGPWHRGYRVFSCCDS